MILFSEDAITCIHRAAVASIAAVDENNYLFLKKLSQVCENVETLIRSDRSPFTRECR